MVKSVNLKTLAAVEDENSNPQPQPLSKMSLLKRIKNNLYFQSHDNAPKGYVSEFHVGKLLVTVCIVYSKICTMF